MTQIIKHQKKPYYVSVGSSGDNDYILSNYASDDLAVQAARTYVESLATGVLLLNDDTFNFVNPVVILNNHPIFGKGRKTTINVSTNINAFELFADTRSIIGLELRSFRIRGAGAGNYGIYSHASGGFEFTVLHAEDIAIDGFDYGWYNAAPFGGLFTNCVFELGWNNKIGIHFQTGEAVFDRCWFETVDIAISARGSTYITSIQTKFSGSMTKVLITPSLGVTPQVSLIPYNLDLTNDMDMNGIELTQTGTTGTTVSNSGAVHVENTANTGIGLSVYSNIAGGDLGSLVHLKHDNTLATQEVLRIENDGTAQALYVTNNGILSSTGKGVIIETTTNQTNGNSILNLIRSTNTSAIGKVNYIQALNDGTTETIEKITTNKNHTRSSLILTANSTVNDAATYTKSGSIVSITSSTTETSGTITDTAKILSILQSHSTASGNVVDIDNRGTGKSLVTENNGTEKFSVSNTGAVSSADVLNSSFQGKTFVTVGTTGADYTTDGVADDVQIQLAINEVNAAGGGIVFVKAGTYIISAQLTTYSDITIEGAGMGATILDSSAWSSNIPILVSTGTGNSDYIFRNFGMIGHFTHGSGSTYATAGQKGILVSSASRVSIQNCYFEKFIDATIIGYDPTLYNDSAGALNIKQVIFENNFVYDCVGGLQGTAEESIIWNANQFEDIGDDAMAFLGAVNSDPRSSKTVVSNNIFKNGRPVNSNGVLGVGVMLKADGSSFGPENVINISITGNICESPYIGIYLANCSQITITGNIINNANLSGCYLSGGVQQVVATGNYFLDPNQADSGNHAGFFASSANDITVSHNQFIGTGSGFKQGINLQGSYNRAVITGNKLYECGGTASIYAETVTDGIFSDNLIDGLTLVRGMTVSGTRAMITDNSFVGSYSSTPLSTPSLTSGVVKNNIGVNPISKYDAGNSSTALTINRVNGETQTVNMTDDCTFTFTAGKIASDRLILILTQDSTGNRTAIWPTNFKKAGGTLQLTATATSIDTIEAIWDGTNWREISRSMDLR